MKSYPSTRPTSVIHAGVALAGLLGFIVSAAILRFNRIFDNNIVPSAILMIAITAISIFFLDLMWQKVHLRTSTGLDFSHHKPSWHRTLTKLTGLFGSLILISFVYWLFTIYHGAFYHPYYLMLKLILPFWLLMALPYFYYIDSYMTQPFDSYWHMGKAVIFQWKAVDPHIIGQHLLSLCIKTFFLPLMFSHFCNDLQKFLYYDLDKLINFHFFFEFLYDNLYFIDVGIASVGYLLAFRLTDTHYRSAEPTLLGWVAALVCYQPFWTLINREYLTYDSQLQWGSWLWNNPIMYGIWGTLILIFTAIYVWSHVSFGARFSNLTHRGIITNGPYRWTKHPSYVAKNIAWWMISIPFMANGDTGEGLRHCLLLLGVNFIYLTRAKTEEWHLSHDPDYIAYALWIDEHGIFRLLRHLPKLNLLKFSNYRIN